MLEISKKINHSKPVDGINFYSLKTGVKNFVSFKGSIFGGKVFHNKNKSAGRAPLPLFIFGFCALVALNSSDVIPNIAHAFLIDLSRWCLVTAIAALGIKTSLKAMMTIGYQPVIVILMESIFIGFWILGGLQLLN